MASEMACGTRLCRVFFYASLAFDHRLGYSYKTFVARLRNDLLGVFIWNGQHLLLKKFA